MYLKVDEKLITERDALMRIDAYQMDFFLHPMIDPSATRKCIYIYHHSKYFFLNLNLNISYQYIEIDKSFIGRGLAASAGAAIGKYSTKHHKHV